MKKLNGTILVTGGAVRIGEAIGLALADAGAGVVIHTRNSRAQADALRDRIVDDGGKAWVVEADLSDPAQASSLVSRAAEAADCALDGLVNSAAVFTKETLDQCDADVLERLFQINLHAPLLLMRAFAAQGEPGVIVNLLDRRIRSLDTTCAPYVLTKKGLAEATKLAALTWAPRIRVNAVAPGAVLPPPGEGEEYLHDKAGPVPLQCRCRPQDVADAVLYACRARTMTGQILFVDGGQHLL